MEEPLRILFVAPEVTPFARTGGLRDTVVPFNPATGHGTGFVFQQASGDALLAAVSEALGVFANRASWRRVVQNAMVQDFSWGQSAARYVDLYRRALGGKQGSSAMGG